MKSNLWASLIVLTFLFSIPVSAGAITIGFNPCAVEVAVGESVDADLVISGLGDGIAPSVSTFDLDIKFDPELLEFVGAAFGDPIYGDQLDLWMLESITEVTPGDGTVNLFELSLDSQDDLGLHQLGSFTMATLTFEAVGLGIGSLDITIKSLGDALGDPLAPIYAESGSVSAVPEPGTILLLSIGIAGLAYLKRKK
jgi:hypothetical protein